jgi:hypothetical protein
LPQRRLRMQKRFLFGCLPRAIASKDLEMSFGFTIQLSHETPRRRAGCFDNQCQQI